MKEVEGGKVEEYCSTGEEHCSCTYVHTCMKEQRTFLK